MQLIFYKHRQSCHGDMIGTSHANAQCPLHICYNTATAAVLSIIEISSTPIDNLYGVWTVAEFVLKNTGWGVFIKQSSSHLYACCCCHVYKASPPLLHVIDPCFNDSIATHRGPDGWEGSLTPLTPLLHCCNRIQQKKKTQQPYRGMKD